MSSCNFNALSPAVVITECKLELGAVVPIPTLPESAFTVKLFKIVFSVQASFVSPDKFAPIIDVANTKLD